MSILKRVLPFLIGITLLFTLASCEVRLSGKYGPDLTTYEAADMTAGEFIFSKNGKVTYTPAGGADAFHGQYEISEDTITFDFEEEGCLFEGTFSFEKVPNTVTIDGYTYANDFHNLKSKFN